MNLLGEAEIDELTNITESTTREMIELILSLPDDKVKILHQITKAALDL